MCDRYRADVTSPSSWYRWYRGASRLVWADPSRALPQPELEPCPSRDYLEASHSHERHTVHGLHEQESHEQDIPCGDGNKGCRLCSSGQSFQPIDKPARYRQNLYCVDTQEVRDPEIAPHGAPVDHRQPGTLRRNAHHTLSLRHHHPPDGGTCKEKEKPECDPELG